MKLSSSTWSAVEAVVEACLAPSRNMLTWPAVALPLDEADDRRVPVQPVLDHLDLADGDGTSESAPALHGMDQRSLRDRAAKASVERPDRDVPLTRLERWTIALYAQDFQERVSRIALALCYTARVVFQVLERERLGLDRPTRRGLPVISLPEIPLACAIGNHSSLQLRAHLLRRCQLRIVGNVTSRAMLEVYGNVVMANQSIVRGMLLSLALNRP